jgi:Na+-transporting NADH:ubiquinone oxidoreductase subunit C
VCSVLLAGAATLLKPRQVENEKLDSKKNVLLSANIKPAHGGDFTRKDINDLYAEQISEKVIDLKGEVVEGLTPSQLDPKKDTDKLPLFEQKSGDEVVAYILPVSGKGLWSTIYGYLALETDMNTVKGITFYKHGETPGLGGEISKTAFTDPYAGKKIFDTSGNLVSVMIAKGTAVGTPEQLQHMVDGISGATLTCDGMNIFMKKDLEKYLPFLTMNRTEEGGE